MQRSPNEKWLVTEIIGKGLYRIDLETMQMLKFSNYDAYNSTFPPTAEFAITNDGQRIAFLGTNSENSIYEINPGCGALMPAKPAESDLTTRIDNECPKVNISSAWIDPRLGDIWRAHMPQFDEDGGEFTFLGSPYPFNQTGEPKKSYYYKLRAANYTPPIQLDYLALGDSFSSGEGDTGKKSDGSRYYLAGTNVPGNYAAGVPEEKCHISSRSYPFLLSTSNNFSGDKMKSIACSGAKIRDIMSRASSADRDPSYLGQVRMNGKPRLEGLANIALFQNSAKDTYIPGRIQQIEFVKRNKPHAITLTIGGNDVAFGSILASCITDFGGIGNACNWAKSNRDNPSAPSLERLGTMIKSQYSALRNLYTQLRLASPKTKIYVLGYPQFIDSSSSICPTNFGLNKDERLMITNGVSYMNQVIKSAANTSGAYYIDIEDSFSDKILCGSDFIHSYVNGTSTAVIGTAAPNIYEQQEGYHPNANGHNAIFNKIKSGLESKSLGEFTECNQIIFCPTDNSNTPPSIPEFFTPETLLDKAAKFVEFVHSSAQDFGHNVTNVIKNHSVNIQAPPFMFSGNSFTKVHIFSNPIDLGSFQTDADGSLNADITIPSSLEPGYHTIVLSGTTYSGDPIDYLQIVLVKGQDPEDVDEDNIKDSNDPCLFVTASRLDVDADGIDDACDPNLDDKPTTPSPSPSPTPTTTPPPKPVEKPSLINVVMNVIVSFVKIIFSLFQKFIFKF